MASVKVRCGVKGRRRRNIEMCWQSSQLSSSFPTTKQQVGYLDCSASSRADVAWESLDNHVLYETKLLDTETLTKKVIGNCNICRRYWKKPISTSHSPDSTLPVFRTELSNPFAVTGRCYRSRFCWACLLQDYEIYYFKGVHCTIHLCQYSSSAS